MSGAAIRAGASEHGRQHWPQTWQAQTAGMTDDEDLQDLMDAVLFSPEESQGGREVPQDVRRDVVVVGTAAQHDIAWRCFDPSHAPTCTRWEHKAECPPRARTLIWASV